MLQLVEQLRANRDLVPDRIATLSDTEAAALVECLKSEADRHWWINANDSLVFADLIIRIGRLRGDTWQVALGTMARGDALKLLGRLDEGWELLGQAGDLFLECGDEVGWARTRVGRLFISVDLGRAQEALADAERSDEILVRHDVPAKRTILLQNTAIVHYMLGDHRRALALYNAALDIARGLGQAGAQWIGPLYTNIGLVYEALGEPRQALWYHEQARDRWAAGDEGSGLVLAELNIVDILMAQGQYRRALVALDRAQRSLTFAHLPIDTAHVERALVECYLQLNRYAEARDLAHRVVATYQRAGMFYKHAVTLVHLATAEAELGNFAPAHAALDEAFTIFARQGAAGSMATTQLRRGRIALRQGNLAAAMGEAAAAAEYLRSNGQRVDYARALLLYGQVLFAKSEGDGAVEAAFAALEIARQSNVLPLRYSAHLLLGGIAETYGRAREATRRYGAAIATIDRVQRGLTITLRPWFLENKGEALRALMRLDIGAGDVAHAFTTLERAKSRALLSYFANREQLRWATDDPFCRALVDELNRLREEHHWFFRLASDAPHPEQEFRPAVAPEQARVELAARERRMRAITEQLYLRRDPGAAAQITIPSVGDVQRGLEEDALLVEYYDDGTHMWAFTLDQNSLAVDALPASPAAIADLVAKLQTNILAAFCVPAAAKPLRGLTVVAQRLLQRLDAALLAPIRSRLLGRGRLVFVPHGVLHYLPLHLLHDAEGYLIDRYETLVLPAAGLVTRRSPRRPPGALAIAHSWEGQLPETIREARLVQRLFGGVVLAEQDANRHALAHPPTQVLHIAAHGEHRLDQPDLSYVQLADGQLYTDDLLQHDLSYELVTLSACETGRARIVAGDEPIGLGRGVLYAGAGALITSLWQIPDTATLSLMEALYSELAAGQSKAAALRSAQRAVQAQMPYPHPAYWGAFQLVGDAAALSSTPIPEEMSGPALAMAVGSSRKEQP
jgi:tetratricopeptide (TPR) repeat protein